MLQSFRSAQTYFIGLSFAAKSLLFLASRRRQARLRESGWLGPILVDQRTPSIATP
jgi:hypothetical protein